MPGATHRRSRAAVDEKQIEVDGGDIWLYVAIDTESKLLLGIDVFNRRGKGPTAAFLHRVIRSCVTLYRRPVTDTSFGS